MHFIDRQGAMAVLAIVIGAYAVRANVWLAL
jgi:hypothetical protein